MPKITPWLWYEHQAEEAAELYTSIFPNSTITAVHRNGPGGPGPEGAAMTVHFVLDGQECAALNGGPAHAFTEAFSFQVPCKSQAEVDDYWAKLTADGGEEGQCGWLKDRYGLSWQIVPTALMELLGDPDPGRAQRATQAMLQMKKLDIAELRRAADQG